MNHEEESVASLSLTQLTTQSIFEGDTRNKRGDLRGELKQERGSGHFIWRVSKHIKCAYLLHSHFSTFTLTILRNTAGIVDLEQQLRL
jgi:hypothetical protein